MRTNLQVQGFGVNTLSACCVTIRHSFGAISQAGRFRTRPLRRFLGILKTGKDVESQFIKRISDKFVKEYLTPELRAVSCLVM